MAAAPDRARKWRRSRPCRSRPWRRASSAPKIRVEAAVEADHQGVPAASTTFRHFSTRFEERSTGFSQNTALPAFTPASIRSACVSVGVPIDDGVDIAGRDDLLSVAHLGAVAWRARPPPSVDVGDGDQPRVGRARCSARGSGRCARRRAARNEACFPPQVERMFRIDRIDLCFMLGCTFPGPRSFV